MDSTKCSDESINNIQELRKRSSLSLELCAFCLDDIKNPVKLNCNHTFCKSCLQIYCEERNWMAKNCPLCRRTLCSDDIVKDDDKRRWSLFICMLLGILLLSLGPFYFLLLHW